VPRIPARAPDGRNKSLVLGNHTPGTYALLVNPGGSQTQKSLSGACLLRDHELKPDVIYGLIRKIVFCFQAVHLDI
jgi:hypothetical protein